MCNCLLEGAAALQLMCQTKMEGEVEKQSSKCQSEGMEDWWGRTEENMSVWTDCTESMIIETATTLMETQKAASVWKTPLTPKKMVPWWEPHGGRMDKATAPSGSVHTVLLRGGGNAIPLSFLAPATSSLHISCDPRSQGWHQHKVRWGISQDPGRWFPLFLSLTIACIPWCPPACTWCKALPRVGLVVTTGRAGQQVNGGRMHAWLNMGGGYVGKKRVRVGVAAGRGGEGEHFLPRAHLSLEPALPGVIFLWVGRSFSGGRKYWKTLCFLHTEW